ncbi:MAG: ATP-binding protein, partial [Desulfobacteraceae bacterium]
MHSPAPLPAKKTFENRSGVNEPNSKMSYNRFTLTFTGKDRHLENHFLKYYYLRHLRFIRLCLYFSLISYGSIGILDAILFPDHKQFLWFIRYVIVMPLLGIITYLTFTKHYTRIWRYCHFLLSIITGLASVTMIVIIPPPKNLHYFQVIVMVLIFNYTLIRARFTTAAASGTIVYVTYVIVVHMGIQTPWDIRLSNSYFLTMVVFVGMFISYAFEKSERNDYYLSKILGKQKERLDQINHTLELRVKERTEQLEKQIEKRRQVEAVHNALESRMRQAQKLDALGTLAGGIAHDFNNVLGAMIGYTELIRDTPPIKDYRTIQNIEEILKAGSRAKKLIRQILTFSRQDEQEAVPVKIDILVKEVAKLIRATLPATIKIRRNIRCSSIVMADPTQIHQVIMNLCTNASHAMQKTGGEMEISLTEVEIDDDFAAMYPSLSAGTHIRLAVSDTGCGIAKEIQDRIFEPFFTTKKPGEGTGLGLSMVHGIIKNHNGAISLYTEPGKGATFSVYLPVTVCKEDCVPPLDLSQLKGNERILYVDDEKQIAAMTHLKLTNLGYKVTSITDSAAAWDYFESNPDGVDMIITDMTMPNLTGIELAQLTLSVRPDLPVILCTGFSNTIDEKQALELGIAAFLNKPIFTHKIATIIRKILDERK